MSTSRSSKKALLEVRVIPKASCTQLVASEGDVLKIRLHALPEDGEANAELIRYLAKALKLPKSSLELVAGGKSRNKRVSIQGVDFQEIMQQLRSLI